MRKREERCRNCRSSIRLGILRSDDAGREKVSRVPAQLPAPGPAASHTASATSANRSACSTTVYHTHKMLS